MESQRCEDCKKKPSTLTCGICSRQLCKGCARFLDADSFAFLKTKPAALKHSTYCSSCFDEKVSPLLEKYNETFESAKQVSVFFVSQRRGIPIITRSKEKLVVEECPDRDETILRLAFFAAERGFNAIVDVDVRSEKVRNESYQKSKWSGSGFPAKIDEAKMDRQDARDD